MSAPPTIENELPALPKTALALDTVYLRKLAQQSVEIVLEHLSTLRAGPDFQPMGPDGRRRLLDQSLPEQGLAPETILAMVSERIMRHPRQRGT
jgi:hypothetical protein